MFTERVQPGRRRPILQGDTSKPGPGMGGPILLGVLGVLALIIGLATRQVAADDAEHECRVQRLSSSMGVPSSGACGDSLSTGEISGFFIVGAGALLLIVALVMAIVRSSQASPKTPDSSPAEPTPSLNETPEERLTQLKRMHYRGLITDEEHKERRDAIIRNL